MKNPICQTAYLAGPMRGYPEYNFPAFDKYQAYLEEQGMKVISPANLDRKFGFNPKTDAVTPKLIRKMIQRDVEAICNVKTFVLMPGWETSKGVAVEKALAEFLDLPIIELEILP